MSDDASEPINEAREGGTCATCGAELFRRAPGHPWFHLLPVPFGVRLHRPTPMGEQPMTTAETIEHVPRLHLQPSDPRTVALICDGCGWHSSGTFWFPVAVSDLDAAWLEHRAEFPGAVDDDEVHASCRAGLDEAFRQYDQLAADAQQTDQLNGRLAALINDTAIALKGEPGSTMLHDWSDLPDVAAREIAALKTWRDRALSADADCVEARRAAKRDREMSQAREVAMREDLAAMRRRAEAAEADMAVLEREAAKRPSVVEREAAKRPSVVPLADISGLLIRLLVLMHDTWGARGVQEASAAVAAAQQSGDL